jgi:hypothetical protein
LEVIAKAKREGTYDENTVYTYDMYETEFAHLLNNEAD